MRVVHICNFASHAGDLRGRALTYENVKRLVLAAGRFSVFEATETKKRADLYTQLHHDPELVCDNTREYPWIYVRRAEAKDGTPKQHLTTAASDSRAGMNFGVPETS